MYYVFNLGWHIEGFLKMIIIDGLSRPDTIEMSLHHLITVYLVGGSYLIDLVRYGSCIELIHDASDIFIALERTFSETRCRMVDLLDLLTCVRSILLACI